MGIARLPFSRHATLLDLALLDGWELLDGKNVYGPVHILL